MNPAEPRHALLEARRVVVKVGTSVVSRPDGRLAVGRIGALAEGVAALHADGRQVLIVSSGAIGLGVERLGLERRPRSVIDQQACAAAGQGTLMAMYDLTLSRLGLTAAQVLLTEADFHHRSHYVSLAATLERLLSLGAVPLLNENDVVATEHLSVFGDNDRLAALVASNIDCDALVLLSDVDSVYTAPPSQPDSERIRIWDDRPVVIGERSAGGTGGMAAKLRAAQMAAQAGVTAVIASGTQSDTLGRLFAGEDVGTVFPATPGLSRRRRWLAFATAPQGVIHVNAGARAALVDRHASLLQPGVVRVDGDWAVPSVVEIAHEGNAFARGLCQRSADEVRTALGSVARDQIVVHRDQLAVLSETA